MTEQHMHKVTNSLSQRGTLAHPHELLQLSYTFLFVSVIISLTLWYLSSLKQNFTLYLFYNNNTRLQIGYEVILLGGE